MTTARALHQGLDALLTTLLDEGLALEVNTLAMTSSRVTWHSRESTTPFLSTRQHATVEQYMHWLTSRAFCAVLLDGSLIQITYDVDSGHLSGHRLAYVPCPYDLDLSLLDEGFSIEDLVRLYDASPTESVALRSPVRFDYDPASAKTGHPAAHLTINSASCRIACVAPIHAVRFVDFVFRNFYPEHHAAHPQVFELANSHVGATVITEHDRNTPHIAWATSNVP